MFVTLNEDMKKKSEIILKCPSPNNLSETEKERERERDRTGQKENKLGGVVGQTG